MGRLKYGSSHFHLKKVIKIMADWINWSKQSELTNRIRKIVTECVNKTKHNFDGDNVNHHISETTYEILHLIEDNYEQKE